MDSLVCQFVLFSKRTEFTESLRHNGRSLFLLGGSELSLLTNPMRETEKELLVEERNFVTAQPGTHAFQAAKPWPFGLFRFREDFSQPAGPEALRTQS